MSGIIFYINLSKQDAYNRFMISNSRGPDNSSFFSIDDNIHIGHHRLSIINPNEDGNQPYLSADKNTILICNGQIYNYKQLIKQYGLINVKNDCEVIIELYRKYGMLICSRLLHGVFSFILLQTTESPIYDKRLITECYIVRDNIGVKPLFIGFNQQGKVTGVASEAKHLQGMQIKPFPPGYYLSNMTEMVRYTQLYENIISDPLSVLMNNIRVLLTNAVRMRIDHTERPLGFLLSGGIDSSIIVNIAHKLGKRDIETFAIGFNYHNTRSNDQIYASLLSDLLKIKHTPISFELDEALSILKDVIRVVESYDVNTIRSSIPMYLLARWISQNTSNKVILSGEGADELFLSYKYGRLTPDGEAAKNESQRLIQNLHQFDLLRAERCFAAHGLELRVPFLDQKVTNYLLSIDGKYKLFRNGEEKWLLRDAFRNIEGYEALQETRIIDREKNCISDGVGVSWVPCLIEYANKLITDNDLKLAATRFPDKTPISKEAYLYRDLFEQIYPNCSSLIMKRELPEWAKVKNDNNDLNTTSITL